MDLGVEAITAMTLGKGARGDWLRSTAGTLGADLAIETLHISFSYMAEDSFKGAIRNALNLNGDLADSLERRRYDYLGQPDVDMSYRTLIRHERRGAELLAEAVIRRKSIDQATVFQDYLEERNAKLQEMLARREAELAAAKLKIEELTGGSRTDV